MSFFVEIIINKVVLIIMDFYFYFLWYWIFQIYDIFFWCHYCLRLPYNASKKNKKSWHSSHNLNVQMFNLTFSYFKYKRPGKSFYPILVTWSDNPRSLRWLSILPLFFFFLILGCGLKCGKLKKKISMTVKFFLLSLYIYFLNFNLIIKPFL